MGVKSTVKALRKKQKKGEPISSVILRLDANDKSILPLIKHLLRDPDGKKTAALLKKAKIDQIWEDDGKWKS